MDEPANDNSQVPPEGEGEESAPAAAIAVPRASVAAAIPTVTPSQPLPHASEADVPPPEHAAAEPRASGDAEAAPEPLILAPEAEARASEPTAEGPTNPLALRIEDEPGDNGDRPSVADQSYAADTAAAAAIPVPYPPATEDVQAAPVTEELVWSSLHDAGPEPVAPLEGPPQLLPASGSGALAHASYSAAAPTHPAVAAEAVAAVPERALWTVTMAPAPPAHAMPSSGVHTARDVLPYLRFAGQAAGAALLTFAVMLLVLVVAYRWIDPPASTLMMGQRLTGTQIEQTWVPLERISPNLVHAVILSEDGGFCRHRGVDLAALSEAIENDRGGSTITMQVVKNLFLWPGRSYVRKALEIALAYLVETIWPKQRVLEIYLNIAEWGPGIFGVEAAAQHNFGKPAARLTAQEAALLAVALPSPIEREAGYPGYLHKRLADNLLTRMRTVRTTMRCVRPLRSGS